MSDECETWTAKLAEAGSALSSAQSDFYHYEGIYNSAKQELAAAVQEVSTCKSDVASRQRDVDLAKDAVINASNPMEKAAAEAALLVEQGKLSWAERSLGSAESNERDKVYKSTAAFSDMRDAEARRNAASRWQAECQAKVSEHCR